MKKRLISSLLALVMALSLFPAALAQDDEAPDAVDPTSVSEPAASSSSDEEKETETSSPDEADHALSDEDKEEAAPEAVSQTSFDDVAPNAWYHDAVIYVYDHGIMNGTNKKHTRFSPEVTMTRAMLMTVLARYDGEDTSGGNTWFVKGQGWAVQNKVSTGVLPDAEVTREQLVTMLWRYMGQPKTNWNLDSFPDAGNVSRYAQDALCWSVEEGILVGKKNGLLEPNASASRAEVAEVLMRFSEWEKENPRPKPEEETDQEQGKEQSKDQVKDQTKDKDND